MTGNDVRHTLKRASLGVPAIVFFVVAAAAPLAATLGAGPVVFAFAGAGGPAMYAIAAVVLLLFGIGFAKMSSHVTSSGGFAALASRGLGRHAGYIVAGVALLAYAGMLIGLFAVFAQFTTDLFTVAGLSIPWQVFAVLGILVVGLLGYLDIQLSAKILGVLMIAEVLILLIFVGAVLISGGADGVNLDAFSVANVFSPTMGAGLLFAFACFVGFEATVIYGEEAKNPKKTIPRATYTSIIAVGLLYVLTMWALGIAYGTDKVQQAAIDNPIDFVFVVNTLYVGEWSTVIMRILVVTSLFAVVLAFHNTLSRYMFSLGRENFLPRAFGRTNARFHSPGVSTLVLSVVSLAVMVAFMIAGADPFFTIYLWLVAVGTLGVLVLQAAGAAAVVGFFARHTTVGRGVWARFIAPTLGFLGLVAAIVLAVLNFDLLTGITDGWALWLPLLLLVAGSIGLLLGSVRSRGGEPIDLAMESRLADAAEAEAEAAAAH